MTIIWFATKVPFELFVVRSWPPIALATFFYLIQTAITTSLIVWKIWSQARRGTNRSFYVPRVFSILRIIVESAAIYTAGMVTMVVLLALDHPGRIAIHACMIPSTGAFNLGFLVIGRSLDRRGLWDAGIVFVLMALRIHAVQEESRYMPASASLMPTWLVDEPKLDATRAQAENEQHLYLPT